MEQRTEEQTVAARIEQDELGAEGRLTKGERTRLRLLAAAEEVFGELPYGEASVAEITRRAGVAQGTFYLYFESKQKIYVELVRHIGQTLRREIAEAVAGLEERAEVERVGFETFFRFIQRHSKIYRIVRQAEFVDRSAFLEYYRTFAEAYGDGLRRAIRRGQVRKLDPEVLAYALMGIGDFVGMRWILWRDGKQAPRKVVEDMMEFILRGLRPDA